MGCRIFFKSSVVLKNDSLRYILKAIRCEKYGREFRIISRWEPTSQTCSCCGFRGGKLDLKIREWVCAKCETTHDRDVNAAINIKVAGGHSETQNGRGDKQKTSVKLAAVCEASTHQEPIQLSLKLFG